jgi:hypothetical protein
VTESATKPERRRVPLELLLGVFALLVCLGAVVGPRVYRAVIVRRMVSGFGGSLSWADRDSLRALMDLNWPEADAAITRLADESPRVAYLPVRKAIVSAAQGLKFTLAAPQGGFLNAQALECYIHAGGSFSGKLTGARVIELSPAGGDVTIAFQLDPPVATRLGLDKDTEFSATISLKELRQVAGRGQAVMVNYDIKKPKRIWREVLDGLDPLLRSAGISL